MPSLPRIRLIFTGGTISMRDTPQGVVPVLSGDELLRDVPGLEAFCRPEVHDFGQLPGPHMTPQRMWELAALVEETLAQGFNGVVITHGTDTLEESAWLCELRRNWAQPVVFVGAMRTSSALSWDGPINLYQACRVAADPDARNRGVLVVMNSTVSAACEVTKTYTEALDTFQAPDMGPVASFDGDELRWLRTPELRPALRGPRLETRVSLLVTGAGDDGSLVSHVAQRGDRGIVIEALGRGNLPPPMAEAAIAAHRAGVVVALTSRCWGGRVSGTYGYEGGGRKLKEAGLLFAPGLPGHKARILLMAALGAGMGKQEIESWLAK